MMRLFWARLGDTVNKASFLKVLWLREFCAKQENRPAAYLAYVRSDLLKDGAKFTNQNAFKQKMRSSEVIRLTREHLPQS